MTGRSVAVVVAVLALIAVPYAITEIYYVNIASQILLYAVFALGLSVLVGYAGLVSLGHAGIFGVASYAVAYLLAAGHGHAVAIVAGLAIALIVTAGFAALSLRSTGISFIMITLALGAGLAAFAGMIGGPILSVYPGLDQDMLPLALVVVILGGTGSLLGSFVGSIVIGFIYNFGQALLPELAYFVLFLPMVLVLVLRPQGLFGGQIL